MSYLFKTLSFGLITIFSSIFFGAEARAQTLPEAIASEKAAWDACFSAEYGSVERETACETGEAWVAALQTAGYCRRILESSVAGYSAEWSPCPAGITNYSLVAADMKAADEARRTCQADQAGTSVACLNQEELFANLDSYGWCWGREGETTSQYAWHGCER